jgi:ABC-type branched-subunit amino acid transport system substrate-binding protein
MVVFSLLKKKVLLNLINGLHLLLENNLKRLEVKMKQYILIFLVLGILLISCSDNTNNFVNENNKIKIAALLDLSGHYSQFGIESKQSMELALL